MNNNSKNNLRNIIWNKLYREKISLRNKGDFGKIPDFKGKEKAAEKLRNTHEWINAKTIFVSPDSAQIPVRENVLRDNKNLIMASPNLKNGYYFLNGETIENPEEAAKKEYALKYKSPINRYPEIGLVVEGSVAVDIQGNRIGKGKGYGDREIDDLFHRKLINKNTPIATTIHSYQLVTAVPMEEHDMKINMIITDKEIIRIRK